jgi:predicted nucleotidyltransferase
MIAFDKIQELSDRIAATFSPEKIVLFGSYAYGDPKEFSDVDLLIIMNYEGHPHDKSIEIWDAVRPGFSVDLLARKPDDTLRRYSEYDPLIREALDKGKILYERNG